MKTSLWACGVLLICGVACGDDSGEGGGGAATSSSSVTSGSTKSASGTGTGTGTSTGTTTATSSGTTTGTGASSGSSGSGTSSSTGGGNAMIKASLDSGQFFADCMPIVGADPVNGSFVLRLENMGAGAGTYEITGATLRYAGGNGTLDWGFDADPSSVSVPAGSTQAVTFDKVAGSGMAVGGSGGPCSYCGGAGGSTVTLVVDGLNEGVVDQQELDLGAAQCAF